MGGIWTSRNRAGYYGIRVYRNAAGSLTNSLAQIAFDQESTLVTKSGLSLSGGDIVCGVAGELQIGVFIQVSSGMLVTSGIEIEIRKNPAGSNTLLTAPIHPGDVNEIRTHHADAVCDVEVGDVIRVLAKSQDSGCDLVTGDGVTWAYVFITR